jgi:hypothetical protein
LEGVELYLLFQVNPSSGTVARSTTNGTAQAVFIFSNGWIQVSGQEFAVVIKNRRLLQTPPQIWRKGELEGQL